MIGTLVDLVSAGLVGAGALRGRRHKLSGELSRLLGLGIALGFGVVAVRVFSGPAAEGLGFIGAFFGGLVGVRLLKRRLGRAGRDASRQWLDTRLPEKIDRLGGAVAGGGTSLVVAVAGVAAGYLAPLDGLHDALRTDSFMGKAVARFIEPADGDTE